MDIEDIRGGEPWRSKIEESIRASGVFLAIIGDRWLPLLHERTGGEDLVRQEIEVALESGIPIIPVLVGSAPVPEARDLPASIEKLPDFNAMAVRSGGDFSTDLEKLAKAIMAKRPIHQTKAVWIVGASLIGVIGLVAGGGSFSSRGTVAPSSPPGISSAEVGQKEGTPSLETERNQNFISPTPEPPTPKPLAIIADPSLNSHGTRVNEQAYGGEDGVLRVSITPELRVGERVELEITASQDVFVCAVHVSSDEFVTELFPGTTGQIGQLKANETKLISWETTPPIGREEVVVYSSPVPIQNTATGVHEIEDFKIVRKNAFFDTRGVPKAILATGKNANDAAPSALHEVRMNYLVKED